MIQQSIVSVSMLMMQGLVNSYGSVFIAGYTAATKIDSLAMMPNMNFSNAMSSYTAQNIGAGKIERVKDGYKANMFMVVVFSGIITLIIFLFGPNLLNMFMDSGSNVQAINYGMEYMRIVSSFYILMGIMFSSNGLLRGAGDMKTSWQAPSATFSPVYSWLISWPAASGRALSAGRFRLAGW